MEFIIVKGKCKLKGEVKVSGSKNSALPILASSLLSDKEFRLSNVPKLVDVVTMINLI